MLRQIFRFSLFAFALSGSCAHNQVASPQPAPLQPAESATATLSKAAPPSQPSDPRRLTATRTYAGHSANGSVLLQQPLASGAGDSPHLKLAGTRAWIALGQQRSDAQDWVGALACARAGIA